MKKIYHIYFKHYKTILMSKHLLAILLTACGMPFGAQVYAMATPEPQSQGQASVTVRGTVLDENNEPIIGASVVQKGATSIGVTTDVSGHFVVNVRPGTKLKISYVGYVTQEVAASNNMVVSLKPTTEQLEQLVVVGYGAQKKANLTGAVSTVDVSRAMDSRPVEDAARALQGAVPGLTITTSNGDFSSTPSIKIRGTGTLSNSASSSPLIVVDGVPVDDMSFLNPDDIADISVLKDAASSAVYGTRAAFGVILITTKGGSSKDRVSLKYTNNFAWNEATVLPQFASTYDNISTALQSAYRAGTDKDVFGMQYEDLLPYAKAWAEQHNGKKYDSYRELTEYVDDNNVGDYRVINGKWLRYADWDIQKTLFQTAPSQKHNVSLEGTSGKTSYRASFGYDGKEGLMRYNPDKLHRYMASASLQTEIFSWLKAGARFNFSDREYSSPNTNRNSYQYMWRWAPFFETYGYVRDADGNIKDFRNDIGIRKNSHVDKTVTTQTRIQGWLQAELFKGMTLQADFTYNLRNQNSNSAATPYTLWNSWSANAFGNYTSYTQATSYAAKSNYKDDMWTTNVFGTYSHTFADDHNLKIMAGFTAEQEEYNYTYVKRNGLVDYNLPDLALTNSDTYSVSSSNTHRATAGFFGRINYDYKGIYLLEANGRYDSSSRFPANDQWAFFPSFSAGYRFSEEAYFKELKQYISNGKVRVSYGEIGNEAVGSNMFLSVVSARSNSASYWLNGTQMMTQYNMPTLVSSSLSWERIKTTDVGLDLGFLNNSLNFGFDWYKRDTNDMLAPGQVLPGVLGADAPYQNAGALSTKGWELSLSWNHTFGEFDVHATANLADARTKITKWNNATNSIYSYNPSSSNYCEGTYYGDIWGFETDRYFEESDFNGKDANGKWIYADGVADQTGLQTGNFVYGPGDIKFKDLNGDGVIDGGAGTLEDHGDLKVIGNALPRYEYSVRLGGTWRGFDLDLFFQGVGKRSRWMTGSMVIPQAQAGLGTFEHQQSYNHYIIEDGKVVGYEIDQNNDYPNMYEGSAGTGTISNIGYGKYNFYPQTKYLINMAYLRLKNLTFGYTLPRELTRKAYIQKARIYVSGENLFFLYNGAGKYKLDPEIATGSYGSYSSDNGYATYGRTVPMMRSYSFGLQVTF
jgi:TonB-linked SusC/RagA family outer membrane protein